MKKGKLTRAHIIEKAAGLFNSHGYFGSSITDVMAATGLEKGGIYNHFENKDELALAAFDHIVAINGQRILAAIDAQTTARAKLQALIDAFTDLIINPSVPGGCPLLNCAVESDDGHPILRKKVRAAMKRLLALVESLIEEGVGQREFTNKLDSQQTSSFIVASLEGGMMLSKLYEDPDYMTAVSRNLKSYLHSCQR